MPFTTYVLVLLISLPVLIVVSFSTIRDVRDRILDFSYSENSSGDSGRVQHMVFGSLTVCAAIALVMVLLTGPGVINGNNYINRMNTLLGYQESYVQSTGAAKEVFRETCRNLSKDLEYDEHAFSANEWEYIQHTCGYNYSVESLILPELRDTLQED